MKIRIGRKCYDIRKVFRIYWSMKLSMAGILRWLRKNALRQIYANRRSQKGDLPRTTPFMTIFHNGKHTRWGKKLIIKPSPSIEECSPLTRSPGECVLNFSINIMGFIKCNPVCVSRTDERVLIKCFYENYINIMAFISVPFIKSFSALSL